MIKLLALVNGAEVVGDVAENGDELIVTNPVSFMLEPKQGGMGVALMPICMTAAFMKTLPIKRDHVVLMLDVSEQFLNMYNSKFGGVVIPQSSIVVPDVQ